MWELVKGNTSVQDVLVTDKDGNPVTNLADATEIKFQVKKSKDSTETPLISKTKSGGGIEVLTDDDLGKLRITIVPSDTENMDAGWMYYMALQIEWGSDIVYEISLSFDGRESDMLMLVPDIVA